jgi:gliding motility-associated-like protein
VYSSAGTYNVRLITRTSNNCRDTITRSVTVKPHPTARLTVNLDSQCLSSNLFTFRSATSAPVSGSSLSGWSWSFGSGASRSSDTVQSPNAVRYSTSGNKAIRLMVLDANGCRDTAARNAQVKANPQAKIQALTGISCLKGNYFTVSPQSSSGADSGSLRTFAWDFGGSATPASLQRSQLRRDTVRFSQAGTFSIRLIVYDRNGCTDTVRESLTVHPQPAASPAVSDTALCLANKGNVVVFTSRSVSGNRYLWRFGDGNGDTASSTQHTYTAAGTYKATSIITNRFGCKDTAEFPVRVYPDPVAQFNRSKDSLCLFGNNFSFTNRSTAGGDSIVSYLWTFGDGSSSRVKSPVNIIYNNAGRYRVGLRITTAQGCSDSIASNVQVLAHPNADFSINQDTQCLNTNGFVFRQAATPVSGSYILNYAWTFDSTASIGQFSGANPDTVVYRNHSSKLVRLIVRDNNTCLDTAYKAVLVLENPVAGWQASDTLQCLQTNRFVFASTGTRAVSGSAIASYRWHFGTGAQPDTGSMASGNVVRYSNSGVKFVDLTVTDNNGCQDKYRSYVRVEPTPVASFTLNMQKQCLNDNRFRVRNTSTSLQTSSVYEWDFGDGTVIRAKDTAHTYVNPGIYRIRLIIRHPSLCNDTFERRITVHPSPKAGITYNANCSQNLSVNLSSTSSVPVGSIVGYLWDFGSGRFAYRKDTTLSYTFPGTHTVKLKVTTDSGCTDEVSRNIVIYERVRAAFSTTRNVCGVNTTVKFTNGSRYSSGNNVKFFWDFGDNSQSSDTNGLHRYNSAGQYTVRLIVVTDDGCRDTARETIRVFDAPSAGFTLSNSCAANGLAAFSNTSRIQSGSMTYSWSFDDGKFSNLTSPTHKYGSFGFYNVRLIATSNNGCRDTVIQRVRIYPVPAVKVKDTILNHCLRNNLFALADTVTLTSGTFTRRWILSDGTSYTQPWLRKTFADSGRFTAVSRITSDQGCTATDTVVFYVKPDPIAAFTINDTSQCLQDNWFVFRNRSSNPGLRKSLDYYWDFGNSDTSTLENPVYKYNAYGLFPISLQVRNSDGCVDVFKQRITIHPHPTAIIGVNDSLQCLQPNQFVFSNLSLNYSGGGALASSWSFGDSSTSNLYSPIHRYTNHGRYTVALTVRSIHGCAADTDMVVRVWPQPDLPRIRFTRPIQCHGGLGALDASATGGTSPYRYSWNGRALSTVSRLDSIPAGLYQLTVSDANGCENGDTFRLLQPDRLVDTIQVLRDVLCHGQSTGMANVTVNGGVGPYQLEWTLGNRTFFGADLVRVPAGKYYLLVTDMLGCRLKDSMIIREPARLQAKVDILRPSPCFGSTARVEAVAIGGVKPYRYFWNGTTEATRVYDQLTAGNHFVEVRDSNGCSVSIAFTITQPVLPSVRIDSVRDVSCFGLADGRIFTTPAGGTGRIDYRWYSAGNQLVSIERNPTGMAAGSYSLLLSDSNRCKDSLPNVALIRQPAQMHVKVTRHENINCFDGNDGRITVAAVGGNGRYNYQWQVLPSPVADSTLASLRVGTYRVLASDRKNCQADTAITLTQRPKNPVLLASDSLFICEKSGAVLTASMNQPASFRWTDPNGKEFPWGVNPLIIDSFNITKSNWYKVVGVDQFGCRDSNRVFVGVKALPAVTSSAQPAIFCYNQNAALRANGALDYRWLRFNRAFGVWDTISGTRDLVFDPFQRSDTGNYLLRGTDRNGCTSSALVRVKTGLDSVIVQKDTQLCAGGLFQIRATGARFYEWQTPRGQFIQNPILSFADLQSADSGLYRLKVTDEYGCEGNYQTFVRVFKKPFVNLSDFSPGKICEDRPLRLVLNTDAERFVWTGPGLPRTQNTSTFYEIPQVGRQNQGVYKVVGTTSFGCMDSSELFVQVNPKPNAGIDIHQGCKVSLATEPLAFMPLWRGRSSSQWFIDDIKASDSAYFQHTFPLSGSYRIRHRIVSDQGCENTSEQLVNVVDAPRVWLANSFTPENGDLLNNVYKPAMTSTVLEYNMAIYDRWGGKVWEWRGANSSTLQDGSWNGRVNGSLLPPGTYVVVVDYSTVCGDDPKKLQQRVSSDLTLFR